MTASYFIIKSKNKKEKKNPITDIKATRLFLCLHQYLSLYNIVQIKTRKNTGQNPGFHISGPPAAFFNIRIGAASFGFNNSFHPFY